MTSARAKRVLEIEASAVSHLANHLPTDFEAVVARLANTTGRVILTGIGKSGIVCRKIAATLASTGTPAFFLHPAEAIHGDLGMIVEGDTVLAISNSGATEELVRLLEFIKRQGAFLVAITGNARGKLAKHANLRLVYTIEEEGCPLGLAPMASTTVTLALGDALAAAIMEERGFTQHDFARFHPGGKLGKRLLLTGDVIAENGHQKPMVQPGDRLDQCLIEISQKRLGMTAVDLGSEGLGIISDGDIRRLLQNHGPEALKLTAGEVCTRNPKTIRTSQLAVEALQMMESHKITSIISLDETGQYAGVIHLHDLWRTNMV